MFSLKKVLALAITCALLLAVAPSAMAASSGGLTGTFSGSNAYYSMTITLNDDGTYSTAVLQGGQTYSYTGYWSSDANYMYFWPNGGTQSALSYWLMGDTLTLTDWNTGDTMTMTRQHATPSIEPHIPEGLIGTWTGQDGDGLLFMTLEADGSITVAYDSPDSLVEQTGTFTVAGNAFHAELLDGTMLSLQFLLTGDTLIFAGETEGETITLTRYQETIPTVLPTPASPPQTLTPPEPTIVPVITPTVTITPSEIPAATPALVLTEAPSAAVLPDPTPQPFAQGLAGIWQGDDAVGSKKLILTPDGRIEIAYDQDAAPKQAGTYTADGSTITAIFDNGTAQDFRYILMGDTMLLTDNQLGNPVTMTRLPPPQPQALAIDPALYGTWGGVDKGTYGEITLTGAGEITFFIPSDPDYPVTYPYTAVQGKISFQTKGETLECTYQIQDGVLQIISEDGTAQYLKKTGPLARLDQPAQESASTVDGVITGTWGGFDGSIYVEITLYGDGSYVKFVPEDEAQSVKGSYMSSGGSIAVLLPDGALQGTYALVGDELTITYRNAEPLKLLKQTGPLTRLAQTGE
jgi:hypothetical protein